MKTSTPVFSPMVEKMVPIRREAKRPVSYTHLDVYKRQVPVQTGIEGDVELEILPGEGEELDETTQIVAAPSEGLTEGMAVTAMAQ